MSDADDKKPPRQACDSCRFRKVKCDRSAPCRNCREASLECQYHHAARRRGPKRGTGRRMAQLRRGLSEFDGNCFQVVFPAATEERSPSECDGGKAIPPAEQAWLSPPQSHQGANAGVTDLAQSGFLAAPSMTHDPVSSNTPLDLGRQFSVYLVAHIQVFLRHMFTIIPVIDGDELLRDAICIDAVPPSRYALILSLCAATRIHLQLDVLENNTENGPGANIPPAPQFTGDALLTMAEAALRQVDVIEVENLDAVMSSYFLFACYGGLIKFRHASFYLNQAISLAQGLQLTHESGYVGLSEREHQMRRRAFWLLFATERTFSLQHRRPIMLQTCIAKPEVQNSDCPAVMNDWVQHVSLFELIPVSIYEWSPPSTDTLLRDTPSSQAVTTRLGRFPGECLVSEGQRFETLITQQWLRMYMWRLDHSASSPGGSGVRRASELPSDVGKVVMRALGSVQPKYKDCHGVGLEQKLFDIGSGLVEGSPAPDLEPSGFGSRDLLFAVVESLAKIRGKQSYLFPALLRRSRHLLDNPDPSAQIATSWTPVQYGGGYDGAPSADEFSAQTDEALNSLIWPQEFDFGAIDLGAWMETGVEELPS